jgi:flavorubredoxin
MLTSIAGFLEFLKGLRPQGRMAAAFGSFGWAGGAVKHIEEILQAAGAQVAQPGLAVKYVPDAGDLQACYDFGRGFAEKVK